MKLAWILALMAGPVMAQGSLSTSALHAAQGSDYIYLYGSPNRTFLCSAYFPYFDTTGNSIYYADQCVQIGEDWQVWPVFPEQAMYVSLDFVASKIQPIRQNCQFVSHTDSPDRSTSWTNADCR